MNNKKWLIGYFTVIVALMFTVIMLVYKVDPFMHYHKPSKKYYYELDNQRSQNYGIIKHFDYTALITGSSMTENFKTTEAEKIFGGKFIKVSFSGASAKELNDCIQKACKVNKKLDTVIRCIDEGRMFDDKDEMRSELGKYPTYLYDEKYYNDVEYIFNKDVIFDRIYPMMSSYIKGEKGGITSFDKYAYWMPYYRFGKNKVIGGRDGFWDSEKEISITETEKDRIKQNAKQNYLDLANKYPKVTFYCFLSPYSAAWWGARRQEGLLKKQIEGEKVLIEELLKAENIKVFSFNDKIDISSDLNNYKDYIHYGEWINSDILKYMNKNMGLLTKENYMSYLNRTYETYKEFDYNILFDQEDEEDRECELR